tara:strand:+ start:8753 stop:10063 length:1311 start_codon:yes stop_codon:yes gene_type:complete
MISSRSTYTLLVFLSVIMISGCKSSGNGSEPDGPSVVFVEEQDGAFQLIVNDEPFYIKGAGGRDRLDTLAAYGGNSIRTWGVDNAQSILDDAYKNGIMVTMGLWVGHERHGFDYDDDAAVQQQLESFRESVKQLKDHPALLMWGVGNEMELSATNMKVWDAVNDIAEMIKEEDPNHPTLTVVAEINEEKINYLKERVPAIDLLGVNSYGGLNSLPSRLEQYGWTKPYVVTEWGINGHWEVGKTSWGAPIEPTSTRKGEIYQSRYEDVIEAQQDQCLGSYVFLWGQKQERTSTWHGLFLDTGEELAGVDAMTKVWSGEWPDNRVPAITEFTAEDKLPGQNVQIQLGKVGLAKVTAIDPDGDPLTYEWVITPESTSDAQGGDAETRPGEIEGLIIAAESDGSVSFNTPEEAGEYRLFVYIFDGNFNAATANIPFRVYE